MIGIIGVLILFIVLIIVISSKSNNNSNIVENNDSKFDKKGKFIFDNETSIKLTNTDVLINNRKTIRRDNIERIKINKNTEHMFFNKNYMLFGGFTLFLFSLISYILIGVDLIFMGAWLYIFILSFIQGAILGGLKKKFINSKIYFFLKDGNVEVVKIKHRSNNIEQQLHEMELLLHYIKKEGIEI